MLLMAFTSSPPCLALTFLSLMILQSGITVGKLLTEKKKLKRKQDKEKKKAIKEAEGQVLSFNCVHIHCSCIFGLCNRLISAHSPLFQRFQLKSLNTNSSPTMMEAVKVPAGTHQVNGGPGNGHVNWAFRHEAAAAAAASDTQPSHEGDVEQGRGCGPDTHSLILDVSTTSFVDTVAVKTLKNVGPPDVPPHSSHSEVRSVRFTTSKPVPLNWWSPRTPSSPSS